MIGLGDIFNVPQPLLDALSENQLRKQTQGEIRNILASNLNYKITQAVDDERRNELLERQGLGINEGGVSKDGTIVVKRLK